MARNARRPYGNPEPGTPVLPSGANAILLQDLYQQPIQRLVDFVVTAYQAHPNMNLEVFVHKADVLSEEYKFGKHFREHVSRSLDSCLFAVRELPAYPVPRVVRPKLRRRGVRDDTYKLPANVDLRPLAS